MLNLNTDKKLKADKNVDAFRFFKIERGVQAIIQLEEDDAMLTVVNPKEGQPYIVYNDDGFDEIKGLAKE